MRSLFKLSLASLAAVALFAGMALAQTTPKFSGNVGAAFGMYTFGATDAQKGKTDQTSEYVTSWESNLRMTMDTEKLTAIVRYRARASNLGSGSTATDLSSANLNSGSAFKSGSNDIYHEIWWKPADNFSIGFGKFQGQAWSQPLSGTYIIINPIEVPNNAASEYWMNWTGISGLDLEFNAGVVQVGVAISSQCKPSCNSAANVSAGSVQVAGSSIVPHLTGKVGDISFRAQLPATSGTYGCNAADGNECKKATDQVVVTGSGLQAGVAWAGMPGLSVALDISSFTEAKTKLEADDRKRSGTSLRVDFSGITVALFSQSDNNYTKAVGKVGGASASSVMTLRYTLPIGSGQIIPEYRSATQDDKFSPSKDKTGKAAALTNSEFRLMGNVNY